VNDRFSVNELIYKANRQRADSGENSLEAQDYIAILDKLQRIISKNHSTELAQVLYSEEAEVKLKNLIMQYLNSERMVAKGIQNISGLVDMVYADMAGMGILSEYLKDSEVEEININGYNGVWVLYRDRKVRLPVTFSSPEACSNIAKKMSRFGNVILDGSKPIGDSFISKGVRMSGAIVPCVDPDAGAIASVRKQKPSYITRENLINWGTATADELDFLTYASITEYRLQ